MDLISPSVYHAAVAMFAWIEIDVYLLFFSQSVSAVGGRIGVYQY
jgi:hypothetical protein